MPSNTFCSNPWRNLEINADGSVRPCCVWKDRLKDKNGNEFNVNQHTFDEIYNSAHLENLREELLNNKKPIECNQCWQEEAANITSLRQHTTPELYDHKTGLKTLKVALGNICNLRCRICGPWASSVWAKNSLKMHSPEEKNNSFEFDMLQKGQWPRTSKTFWKDFENAIPSLEEINFYGGEPLLVKQHFDILEKLSNSNNSKDIVLRYITNGTIFPDKKIIDSWKKFKHVEISLSIDNIFEKFEYERSRGDWQQVVKNLDSFYDLHTSNPNIRVLINTTVSVFNVLDLKKIITWFNTHYPRIDVKLSFLTVKEHFCIKYLPDNVKSYIKDKLSSHQDKNYNIKNAIDFMNDVDDYNYDITSKWIESYNAIKDPSWPICTKKEDFFNLPEEIQKECKEEFNFDITKSEKELLFEELKQEIKKIDLFREEKLVDSHPELNSLLKIY